MPSINGLSFEWMNGVTCLGLCRISCVVVVARMALLLPGLSCKFMERPVTSWTPSSVMVTFSSTTLIVVLAKIASDSGENTCHRTILDTINYQMI